MKNVQRNRNGKRRPLGRWTFGMIILVVTMMLLSANCFAKDVSNNSNKPKIVKVNKMISDKFEKVGDVDCFAFKSGGGKYKLVVYDLSGRSGEELYEKMWDDVSVTVMCGDYMYFSAAAGAKKQYMMGSYNTYSFSPVYENGAYKTYELLDLGKHKKGRQVGIILKGGYKGKYKFKIIGKKAK